MQPCYDRHTGPSGQSGSALITTVLILLVVTIIGILSTRTANIEVNIATHDKLYKRTWFATDATVQEFVPELTEQAIELRLAAEDVEKELSDALDGGLTLNDAQFYLNESPGPDSVLTACYDKIPEPDNADMVLAAGAIGPTDLYVRIYGDTEFSPGNALQLTEGYEGEGLGAGRGGAMIIYDIRGLGVSNSEVRIMNRYRHVIR
ncbi:pilus assembly PilX family protein [Desulfatitalea alkaliphila]|uniref:PilX N-terminal domain-containing pilus assembly protein n=1 Tax=Desulfatitalea alkaliphila TaxID=2929485 RepID=A0AA41QZK5_9BACT|nr:pilus assembly PilX N-terminal domain-containing protein [Desulfatitalea alkaliphila]MCJ8499312.1 PilX N-terminal domain-containing pilus assembly protein [Desulfatitalea alkaliphila]